MLRDVTFTVGESEDGVRLDAVVRVRFPASPPFCVREAIRRGRMTVNGRPLAKGRKVRAGDAVRIVELAERTDLAVAPQPELPLTVLYEDDDLIALDKPAGQPTHPLAFHETGTLLNALVARYPALARVGGDPLLPAVVHRLDTDTSGIVLAAKNDDAYAALRRQFRAHEVRKTYLALVHGNVTAPGRLDTFLVRRRAKPCLMAVADAAPEAGKKRLLHAITEYEPVERFAGKTLVRVTIRTGVTHQVRCHLAHAGFPIVGDRLYGSPEEHPRHFLHAAEIAFTHPVDGRSMIIRSALPPEFQGAGT